LVENQQVYHLGYNIGQFHSDKLIGTLNGTLDQQREETGDTIYQSDISSFLTQENLQGLEFGYQNIQSDYFFDLSFSIFYLPISTWIEHSYPIQVDSLGRAHTQASIGRLYKKEDTFLFASILLGSSSTWMEVHENFSSQITLDDDEESPSLKHNTLRTGIKIGARSGKDQGLRVSGELGIDLEGNTDRKFFLGYFFRL
jgi:hypothetical protein